MVCAQVIGNDATIAFAGSQGQLELNTYNPVIILNLLQSIRLLADAVLNFHNRCALGIEANEERIAMHLSHSLMLATALNREIGYDKASKIVLRAHTQGETLKEAALALGLLTEEEFDRIVDPHNMIGPRE